MIALPLSRRRFNCGHVAHALAAVGTAFLGLALPALGSVHALPSPA